MSLCHRPRQNVTIRHFLVMSMGRVWELRFHEQSLAWEVAPKGEVRYVV